ncbi:MAG TPA: MlaD family protein [Rhodocyclaceae bacterium]|nr:MlaD family protein [Rhodocyclaceae bacterium]
MLKQRARDRLYKRAVGALVLASVLTLVIVLRMYQQASGPFDQSFRLLAVSPRAHGLEIDSPVTMAGIKIGRVLGIGVTPENTVKLELEVQGKYRDKVRDDSLATLSKPLIGSSFIDVSMGSPNLPEIPSGQYIALTTLPDINDVVASIGPKLDKIDAILDNVTTASADFKMLIQKVGSDIDPLSRSMKNVEKTTREAAEAAARVNQATAQIKPLLDEAKQATTQVNAILSDVKQGSARVDSLTQRADTILANGEVISQELKLAAPQIVPVLDAGRDTLNEADDVLRAAKNSIFLRGSVPPTPTETLPASPR